VEGLGGSRFWFYFHLTCFLGERACGYTGVTCSELSGILSRWHWHFWGGGCGGGWSVFGGVQFWGGVRGKDVWGGGIRLGGFGRGAFGSGCVYVFLDPPTPPF